MGEEKGAGLFSWLSKLRFGRGQKAKVAEEQELMAVKMEDGTLSLDDLLPREGHLPTQIGNVTECALLGRVTLCLHISGCCGEQHLVCCRSAGPTRYQL